MTPEAIQTERDRRLNLWHELGRCGGPDRVAPSLVRELRLHRGQQGVFRDQELTASLTPSGTGIAVGLLHTGSSYADDLFDDGVIYHYPVTARGERDRNEIVAMKACAEHTLPVFVVITPSPGASTRDVRLGWVTDHDDASGQLLITFSDGPLLTTMPREDDDARPFELMVSRTICSTTAKARPGQGRFRFAVFKRYGNACAFCSIIEPKLLEAAHLCPVEENGTDDPRNGLVMCLTHHKAFDAGLLLIDPASKEVLPGPAVSDLKSIGVAVVSIGHLRQVPHRDALCGPGYSTD
jgi:hypothetical protein